jgi:hypothetical protein
LRHTVGALAAAIGLIALLALGSRFQPNLYPADTVAEFLPTERARLNYPLGYWNGLAALMALGLPLLLWLATSAGRTAARGLALALLPAMALVVYLTLSRGGAIEVIAALAVLFALHPRRLRLLVPALLGAAGGTILITLASVRDDLTGGLGTDLALAQGDQMLVLTVVVCAAVGLLGAAVELGIRRGRLRIPHLPRRRTASVWAGLGLIALIGALALGAPDKLGDGWEDFKQPATPDDTAERFTSASGSGRYQWWTASVDAFESAPIVGIGPGTWEFWWARSETTVPGFVRDAHSLYLETLAELGIIGLGLVVALVGGVVVLAIRLALHNRTDVESSGLLAAAAASTVAFAVAAAGDWAWELTVLPSVFLLLGAGIAARARRSPEQPGAELGRPDTRGTRLQRPLLVAAGIASVAVLTVTMLGTKALRESQAEAAAGRLDAALARAERAEDLQPYAASPILQQALVLELGGDLSGAARAAREATTKEPTNWRTWLVRARIDAIRGRVPQATRAYRQARSLNPRSPLFPQ